MKKDQQLYTVAVFDIDSASVAVSVVSYKRGIATPINEVFTKRVILDDGNIKDFFAHTLRAVEQLAKESLHQSTDPIEAVYLILGAPWVASQKRVIHYERTSEFLLNPEIIKDVLAKEAIEPLSRNLDFHAFKDLHVFESVPLDWYLNGYPTLHPYDTKTKIKNLDIHTLLGVISGTTRDALVHTIERSLGKEPVLASNALVSFLTMKNFLPHVPSSVVLDIGGTNTQVYVIQDTHLRGIATFPVGMTTILDSLSQKLSIGKQKARSLLKLYTQSNLDKEYQLKITSVMNEVFEQWYSELFEIADLLSREQLLPATWCFVAPNDLSSWLEYHLMKAEGLNTHVKARSNLTLISLAQVLGTQSHDLGYDHIQDTEMLPLVDVVGRLINEQK